MAFAPLTGAATASEPAPLEPFAERIAPGAPWPEIGPDRVVPAHTAADEALLDEVQRRTLCYFWEYAHPDSGMARERSNEMPDTCTIGGTGFGVMALVVGVERGWLPRAAVLDRLHRLCDFLARADRFHGVWPHWLHGTNGRVVSFSPKDDGGDLVETSYLIQGLLTVRQYFDRPDRRERALRRKIDRLWREVEWNWYTRGEDVLFWHWSPNHAWAMNHRITGYNECLITYVLAAASPRHPVRPEVYHRGWVGGGWFDNRKLYFGRWPLRLGTAYGGPLFFAHYSFLGLDPRGLRDAYADYWQQNVAHSLINWAWCQTRRRQHRYAADCWGLTACDTPGGYAAHCPTDDRGVIAPTAALSSMPYVPHRSLAALRLFLGPLRERLFTELGLVDAFKPDGSWTAASHLAIDQGPIVVMIENYRSGLLWRLFMQDHEVRRGLARLGFTRQGRLDPTGDW